MLDAIEDEVKAGGYIIDWHACDLFPKSWIDLVVVLRVDSTLLYDRLKARYVHSQVCLCVCVFLGVFGKESRLMEAQRLSRGQIAREPRFGNHGGAAAGGEGFV